MFTQIEKTKYSYMLAKSPSSPTLDTKLEEAELTKTLINLPFPHKQLPLNPIME